MPDPEQVPVVTPPADPPTSRKCPECGSEFDGISVSHASETLAALREEAASLKKELAAEKAKQAVPAPAAAPPAETPPAKKRGGMLYRKRAA